VPRTAETKSDLRILGLTMEPVAVAADAAKNAGLFAALDHRFDLVGLVRPRLPMVQDYAAKLRYVYPTRDGWRARAGLNKWVFNRRSAMVERELAAREGDWDLLVQWQTVFGPGLHPESRDYIVYTDNIYPLTERFLPQWAPLSRRQAERWTHLERETCRHAHYVFTMGDYVRGPIIENYGCDPDRVVAVGAGTNTLRSSLDGRSYSIPAALFAGAKFEMKGGMVLLRAWETVRRRIPEAELWITGFKSSPPQDLPEGVRWFGYVPRSQLLEMLERAAFLVLPSLYDSSPHIIREAMAHGLACVASDCGGIPELVREGVTGLLVPPGEPEPLADALVSFFSDLGRAEAMGRRAHAEILTTHTWDDVAGRMAPYLERAREEAAVSA
jgi:glycosyltransferase involved in cell wall biosynthesis